MASPTYAQFLADPEREENVTLELYPQSISAPFNSPVLYFTMQEFGTALSEVPSGSYIVPSGQLFARRIDGGFQRSMSDTSSMGSTQFMYGFIPQDMGGKVTLFQRHGDIDLGSEPPELLGVPLRRYAFGGRRAVVRHGGKCSLGEMRLADYRILLDGECAGQPLVEASQVHFILRGKEHRLDQPLLTRKLYGTDWCVVLDGTLNGYILFPSISYYNITSELFKFELLIWLDAYPASTGYLISKGESSINGYNATIDNSGIVRFSTCQSGVNQVTELSAIPTQQWVRVSFLRSSTETITGYYDGEDVTTFHDTHIDPANSAGTDLLIGQSGLGAGFLRCAVDDIRLATDSAAGFDEDTIDLQAFRELDDVETLDYVLYAKCNERLGATVPDSSPVNNDGTADSGATFAPSGMGRTDAAGTLIPLCFGEKEGITPLPIDLSVSLHMVSAGSIESFEDVRIGLNPDALDGTLTTDHPEFLNFIYAIATASVPDGSYDTYSGPYWTMICLGDAPNHSLTVHIKGDNRDSTYRETPVALVRHVVTTYGETPFDDTNEITDAEFDALEAEHPEKVALYLSNEDTIQTVIDSFLISFGGVVFVDDVTGRLRIKVIGVTKLALETPVATLTNRNVELGSLRASEGGTPYWKVNVYFDQCPTMMGTGQILEEMRGTEIEEFHKREWRVKSTERRLVRALFLDAPEYDIYTTLTEPAKAQAEANRLSANLKRPDQGFAFFSKHIPDEVGLYDAVRFHYQDIDANGDDQSRYGTTENSVFYVVGKRVAIGRGGFDIALWRPEVPA